MSKVKIGVLGKITAGDGKGQFLKVVDDSASTGGFLILLADNPEFRGGHDDWVEDKTALSCYFQEACWLIEWLDK